METASWLQHRKDIFPMCPNCPIKGTCSSVPRFSRDRWQIPDRRLRKKNVLLRHPDLPKKKKGIESSQLHTQLSFSQLTPLQRLTFSCKNTFSNDGACSAIDHRHIEKGGIPEGWRYVWTKVKIPTLLTLELDGSGSSVPRSTQCESKGPVVATNPFRTLRTSVYPQSPCLS